jgi:hypothetical protein
MPSEAELQAAVEGYFDRVIGPRVTCATVASVRRCGRFTSYDRLDVTKPA